MKEKDLFSTIEKLLLVVEQQAEEIQLLKQVVKKQEETIELQSKEILALQDEIELLKRGKNSKNSSKPPSTDFSTNKSLRKPTGKKPGGQPGHEGNTLEFSSAPDEIVSHRSCFCRKCGNNLEHIAGKIVEKRQMIDIPPCHPIITQHQIFAKQCNCGEENIADFPPFLKASIQYGPGVESLIAYLSVRQYMPYNRIVEYLNHYYNLTISEGTIANLLKKFAEKAQIPYRQIKANLINSPIVGSDETGAKVNGSKAWMHTWQDKFNTYIVCTPSRSSKAIEDQFPCGFPNSILISDAWPAQLKTPAKGHQLCTAHLQRELRHFVEDIKNPWAKKLDDLLADAIKVRKQGNPSPQEFTYYQEKLLLILQQDIELPLKINAFKNRLIKNKDSLLRFLLDPNIPSDNNASERAIRNIKVKQKISGQFKSWDGAICFATIRSVIDTVLKTGQDLFQALSIIANFSPE